MGEQFHIALEEHPMEWIVKLCETQDKHLELLRNAFSCDIVMRDNELRILNEGAITFHSIESVVKALFNMIEAHIGVSGRNIGHAYRLVKLNRLQEFSTVYQKTIGKAVNGKLIYPKTIGQQHLFKRMCNSGIVFVTGMADTGKAYLAVVYVADLLEKEEIHKIILIRPAVEVGENLGPLLGDLKEKVNPYLRPPYDALYDTLGQEQVGKLSEKEVIEIASPARMRGRTLDSAFIMLNEAQNTTHVQMKMFLTGTGPHSRIVITGDVIQIDLIKECNSGLLNAEHLLSGIEGISFVELISLDVVRNPLVQRIIERYGQEEGRYGRGFIN